MDNPFAFGPMLRDPHQFIGRQAERELIMARLNAPQPGGSAVIGERRIGKSSLLYYLCHPRPDETLLPAANLRLVYVDAQAPECGAPDGLRAALLRAALAPYTPPTTWGRRDRLTQLRDDLARNGGCDWPTARAALEQLPYRPVICLDELEAVVAAPFDNRFFDALRSWAQEGLVAWITASKMPPSEVAHKLSLTSPFFNILATVRLEGLTEAEAEQLLDRADATPYAFTPRERRTVRAWAGTNPYHLQMVGWYLWEMKRRGRVDDAQLRREVCAQPSAPALCHETPRLTRRRLSWLLTAIPTILLFAALYALYLLVPDFQAWVNSSVQRVGGWVKGLGETLQWLIPVLIVMAAVGVGVWQRKGIRAILRDLWERLT